MERPELRESTGDNSQKPTPNSQTALGIYVHIPFCSSICNYCNFNRGLFDADLKTRYIDALRKEIVGASGFRLQAEGSAAKADTIFFGGGTPSLLEPREIAAIIAALQDAFDVAADALHHQLRRQPRYHRPGFAAVPHRRAHAVTPARDV